MKTSVQFLLKFGERENIESLLSKGEIFMNSIKWFSEVDKKGIGDKYEGVIIIQNFKNHNLTIKIPGNDSQLTSSKFQYRENLEKSIGNIYSTYAVSDSLLLRKSVHRIDRRMMHFGTHCLLIKNPRLFTNLIFEKLANLGIVYNQGLVEYKNYDMNDIHPSIFNKTHRLSYQKEHRIIALTGKNTPLKFEIGGLESIAEIFETKEIVESMTVMK